ncbi:MAG TPA: DNA polymerase III subunit gamma/tau [Limnochordales bacterium]
MSYVSLYRKWRPQTFADVTGQAHVVRTLTNALADKRIAHAYLFTGPRGTGKTTLARLLAKGLNCAQGPTPEPCNQCVSCRRIAEGTAMDVVEIDGASNRGIDEIRDVRERVRFAPTEGPYKIYIIDEVHMLTNEAFNALLKVLEEPPKHVVFVFATTEPHKIPPTVASRCQRFDFRRLSLAETVGRLAQVAAAEGIDATEDALRLIARYAEGSLRDGLGLLDQCRAFADRITPDVVINVLGVAPREQVIAFADVLAAGDAARGLALIKELQEAGRDLRQFLRDAARHLRDVLLCKVAGEAAVGGNVIPGTEESEALRRQAAALPVPLLLRAIETLGAAEADMRYAAQAQLPLEMAIVRLTRPEAQVDLDSLLQRIEQLERKVAALANQRAVAESVTVPGQAPAAGPSPLGPQEEPVPPPFPAGEEAAPALQPRPAEGRQRAQRPVAKTAPYEAGTGTQPSAMPAAKQEGQQAQIPAPRAEERAAAARQTGQEAGDELALVVKHWDRLNELLKEQRHISVQAFLREGRPVACRDGVVTIEFPPDRAFHQASLQLDQNRKVVEQFLSRLIGRKLKVTTVLAGQWAEEPQPGAAPASAPTSASPQPLEGRKGADRAGPAAGESEAARAGTAVQADEPQATAGDAASGAGANGAGDDDIINNPAVQEALRLFGGRIIHVERHPR